ncbi:MAG: hypothetical protein WCW77_00575 [Patescibacteria group bacterium]|jgi:hypothetical protein
MSETFKKICHVCHEPYDYQLRVIYNPDGTTDCRHDGQFVASKYEVTTRQIKQDRKTFSKDILQPFRKDGSVNDHFKKVYGNDHQAFKGMGNKKNIKDLG